MFKALLQQIRRRGGVLFSTSPHNNTTVLENIDGGQTELDNCFVNIGKFLGEGQFGVVTLVQMREQEEEQHQQYLHQSQESQEETKRKESQSRKSSSRVIQEQQFCDDDDDGNTSTTITVSSFSCSSSSFHKGDDPQHDENKNKTINMTTTTTTTTTMASSSGGMVFACKTLRKGIVFKDNVLYAPLSSQLLQTEVDCLRRLNGDHHCLKLHFVFETPNDIVLLTDVCTYGHLLDYQEHYRRNYQPPQNDTTTTLSSSSFSLKLPVVVISSIAFQLLDAIHHCANHGIIHRDIKSPNCLFVDKIIQAILCSRREIRNCHDHKTNQRINHYTSSLDSH